MTHNCSQGQALKALEDGMYATRLAWGTCRIVRMGCEADWDYLNFDPAGVVVDDRKHKVGDCKIGVYRETEDDKNTKDWIILTPEEA